MKQMGLRRLGLLRGALFAFGLAGGLMLVIRVEVTAVAGQTVTVNAALSDVAGRALVTRVEVNPRDGLKYVYLPPRTFMMGCSPGDSECSDDESPAHQVTITKGFWMGQTEVTVGAYKRFASATARRMPESPSYNRDWSSGQMPIVNVTWDEAQSYCRWAGGRLPTEAEWEYAARASSAEARYGPLDDIAWYDKNSGAAAHDVAQKRPNSWGLFDMLGNVWEWVDDWFDENYYRSSPATDPGGPSSDSTRVVRGGSWDDSARNARVSYRTGSIPSLPGDFGLRCAREVSKP